MPEISICSCSKHGVDGHTQLAFGRILGSWLSCWQNTFLFVT